MGSTTCTCSPPEQPDLNWRHPDVAEEYERILRFWLDRGTDGVRVDVAAGLFKDAALRDNPGVYSPGLFGNGPEQVHTWDQPEVHDVYRRWNALLGSYPHEPASVGEVCLADLDATAAYCRADELGSAFTIELLKTAWGAHEYAHAIAGPLEAFGKVGARPAWVLGNHDKSRMPWRFGGGHAGLERALAAGVLLAALPGQWYVYGGDELGLPDADLRDEDRKDPIFLRSGGQRAGRDGVRVPLPIPELATAAAYWTLRLATAVAIVMLGCALMVTPSVVMTAVARSASVTCVLGEWASRRAARFWSGWS